MSENMKFTGKHDTYKRVATNIVFTAKWILDHCSRTLKEYEPTLTVEQFNLLQVIKARCADPDSSGKCQEPTSINFLKEHMMDQNSDVSRLVEKLRRKGWVERHDNESDRRVADVCLTKKGFELLLRLETEEKRWPIIFSGISEKEAKKLNEILGKVSKRTMQVSQVFASLLPAFFNLVFILISGNSI